MSDVPPPRGCPDPSLLALFAAGTLDAEARAEVERHVADCPECPVVIAETVRFLQTDAGEPETEPAKPHGWWWLVAAVAAFCVPALVWQLSVERDPLQGVKRLAAGAVERRVEGRLAELDHAPLTRARTAKGAPPDTRLLAEAERLAESGSTDARALHARGIAFLLAGDRQRAVEALDAAVQRERKSAALWNDLSVAYLELAIVGHEESLEPALAATDEALRLAPSMAAARFNRALVLQHLGRKDAALRAFHEAVAIEPDSPWAREARERISLLE